MYIHIPKEKRTKLDPSGRKGIFVGYSESSKAYRIYFPGYKKINISKDVTFDESIAYNKSRKERAMFMDLFEEINSFEKIFNTSYIDSFSLAKP